MLDRYGWRGGRGLCQAMRRERRRRCRLNQIHRPEPSRKTIASEISRFMPANHAPAKLPSCHSRGQLRGELEKYCRIIQAAGIKGQ